MLIKTHQFVSWYYNRQRNTYVIDRHGINKSDRGPLAKCSFEETPDIIARAAVFGELDKVQSVSSNIMLGQEVPVALVQ